MTTSQTTLKSPRTLICVGMVFLILFNAWPRLIPLTAGLGEDWIDGIRGLLLGLAAGIIIRAVVLTGRQRRGGAA